MSETNLVLRLLKEQREEMKSFRDELKAFRQEVNERFDRVENTIAGMASHLFALTHIVNGHERRLRKLETRPAK